MTQEDDLKNNLLAQSPVNSTIREPLEKCRDLTHDDHTFTVSIRPDTVLIKVNHSLPDGHSIEGTVTGIADGKIHIKIKDESDIIDKEYGSNRIIIGDELWIQNYGTIHVEDIWEENGRIYANLFSEMRMRRQILSWIKEEHGIYTYIDLINSDNNAYYQFFVEHCDSPIGEKPTPPEEKGKANDNRSEPTTKYSV